MPRKHTKRQKAQILTREDEELREQARHIYQQDRRRFFRDCLRIKHRDRPGVVAFELNEQQESLLRLIENIEQFNVEVEQYYKNHYPHQEFQALKVEIMVLKQRKGGVSTLCEALAFHTCEFNPSVNALCMANKQSNARNIASIAKQFHYRFPDTDPPIRVSAEGLVRCSDDLLEWDPRWDSRIIVATGSVEDIARGFSYDFLHFSEVAHFPNFDAIAATKEAAMGGSYILEETTAKGLDGYFYPSWQKAMFFEEVKKHWDKHHQFPDGWNGKFRFFWGWWQDRGYQLPVSPTEHKYIAENLTDYEAEMQDRFGWTVEQIKWRRKHIATVCQGHELPPEDFFRQEMPSTPEEAFVSSGHHVFDERQLIKWEQQAQDLKPHWHGFIKPMGDGGCIQQKSRTDDWTNAPAVLFKERREGSQYICGIDTAEGKDEGDYSVISVWDRLDGSAMEEVARFRSRTNPHATADIAWWLIKYYNEAYCIPEANPPGNATVQRLIELGCHLLYHRKNEDMVGNSVPDDSFSAGFKTMKNTKSLLISHGQHGMQGGMVLLRHPVAIKEWRIYTNNDGRFSAPKGFHDDCVMADLLAVYGHFVAAPPITRKTSEQTKIEEAQMNHDPDSLRWWVSIKNKKERSRRAHVRRSRRTANRLPKNPFS